MQEMKPRLNYFKAAPALFQAQLALNKAVEDSGLDRGLLHLIKVRASQINGCAYCLDLHTQEARADGETGQRLHVVSAWRESPAFSAREQAALAWTEAVTLISNGPIADSLYDEVRAQFSETDLVALTMAITVINSWNRFAVSFRAVHKIRD